MHLFGHYASKLPKKHTGDGQVVKVVWLKAECRRLDLEVFILSLLQAFLRKIAKAEEVEDCAPPLILDHSLKHLKL